MNFGLIIPVMPTAAIPYAALHPDSSPWTQNQLVIKVMEDQILAIHFERPGGELKEGTCKYLSITHAVHRITRPLDLLFRIFTSSF